jgi:RNA polymerase sigma-70 factor (ECF subfamily)
MGPHPDNGTRPQAPPSSLLAPADLERVQARDPQALGLLFDAYFGRIYSLAYRLMGNEASAQDIAQEVFLRVHKAAHQLDPSRDPAPWLLTITTNLCREKWRSRQGRQDKQTLSLDAKPAYAADVAAASATPDQEAEAADQSRLLESALARLPEPMRLVVVLHDLQGQTHEEIAVLLAEAAPAVRKRYSRALVKLRELLQDHRPDVLE